MNTIEEQLNNTKKLWWLHDSYWHATMVREFGEEKASQLNLDANDSLRAAKMTSGYACGCQIIRNGVMKALKLKPLHSIEESLVKGDGRCVIKFCFEPS